ncbi:MAG: hypothetical protein OEZ34_10250 [Spirochaetia bacterium]|nr:hypothetical protein [Spirochaetia bacterium]
MKRSFPVYIESGKKRVFAGALDWPGWCRPGKTEDEALSSLLEYGPEYENILLKSNLSFTSPIKKEQLMITERLSGNATTDFGAISMHTSSDMEKKCKKSEIDKFERILKASWKYFDKTVNSSGGKELKKGPRGGGRSLDDIVKHIIESDINYLSAVGWKFSNKNDIYDQRKELREAILSALHFSASGEIPEYGPRGGHRWTARFFVRRVTWHVIAHTWEIKRRVVK